MQTQELAAMRIDKATGFDRLALPPNVRFGNVTPAFLGRCCNPSGARLTEPDTVLPAGWMESRGSRVRFRFATDVEVLA